MLIKDKDVEIIERRRKSKRVKMSEFHFAVAEASIITGEMIVTLKKPPKNFGGFLFKL